MIEKNVWRVSELEGLKLQAVLAPRASGAAVGAELYEKLISLAIKINYIHEWARVSNLGVHLCLRNSDYINPEQSIVGNMSCTDSALQLASGIYISQSLPGNDLAC